MPTRLATQAPPRSAVPLAESGRGRGRLIRSGVPPQMAPNVQTSEREYVPRGPTRPAVRSGSASMLDRRSVASLWRWGWVWPGREIAAG
jgi:hypothetical protein